MQQGDYMLEVLQKHLEQHKAPTKCAVGSWLDTLDNKYKDLFKQLIEEKVESAGLYRDLVSNGYELPFKSTVFRQHMKGYCVCQK